MDAALFEADSFEKLAAGLKDPGSRASTRKTTRGSITFCKARLFDREALPADVLLGYDQNIVRHWLRITERRNRQEHPAFPSIFSSCALLFTEIYLDRYFRDPGQAAGESERVRGGVQRRQGNRWTRSALRAGRPEQARLLECHGQRQDAADARQYPPVPALPGIARPGAEPEPHHPA